MTDKELLELAAKAANLNLKHMAIKPANAADGDGYIGFMTEPEQWPRGWFDPLTDDGDALRLAVKLGLDINQEFMLVETSKYNFDTDTYVVFGVKEPINLDPYAATRRAIVRAAAEIGKEMK